MENAGMQPSFLTNRIEMCKNQSTQVWLFPGKYVMDIFKFFFFFQSSQVPFSIFHKNQISDKLEQNQLLCFPQYDL